MDKIRSFRYVLAILLISSTLVASASAECSACSGGNAGAQNAWEEGVRNWVQGDSIPAPSSQADKAMQRTEGFTQVLVPVSSVQDHKILIDVSPEAQVLIKGALSIPYTELLTDEGRLKSAQEIAQVLGDAGLSQDDQVIIYSSDISEAALVYWIMKYLGHEKLQILDGGVDEWTAEGKPTEAEPEMLPAKIYTPNIDQLLLSTSEYLNSGQAQIIDARTMQEFGAGSIAGAINIPWQSMIVDGKIKDEATLQKSFAFMSSNKPVVVYANTASDGSVVWLALTLLGYDARMYPLQD